MSNEGSYIQVPERTYSIETISNGYLLVITDFERVDDDVRASTERLHFANVTQLLQELSNALEPSSRHTEKRTYVIEAPGDKHESWTEAHSRIIFGD